MERGTDTTWIPHWKQQMRKVEEAIFKALP